MPSSFPTAGGDDFFDQILSSWPDISNSNPSSSPESRLRPPALQLNHSLQHSLLQPTVTGGNGVFDGYMQYVSNRQQFDRAQGGHMASQSEAQAAESGGGGAALPRQRVRARRGQATDPHSIAERLRRERIAERMKGLQELVPNANKTDKASMLDEIIDYVKFLQLQVKVLSMSRLGGAAAVAPMFSDMCSEGRANGAAGSDSLKTTEHQVAKLMEEDMGTAMQYLQGKGLCLMPISLASAISTVTCRASPLLNQSFPSLVPNADVSPSSPNMSALTNGANVDTDVSR